MSSSVHRPQRFLAALAVLVPGVALAHGDHGTTAGFAAGFGHPLAGADHILAMVGVGLLAAQLGARARWALPLAFMAFMLVGGLLALLGVGVPFVGAGIALSIVAVGVALAAGRPWPLGIAVAAIAFFAIFHGHAHGSEMPANASGGAYALGFVMATGLLHLAGLGLGLVLGRAGQLHAPQITRLGGTAIALSGVFLLSGVL
jgi:urease accessory protein